MAEKNAEMPLKGKGVELLKIPELDKIGDEFIEKRDAKAQLATDMTALNTKAIEAMDKHKVTRYTFGDQEIIINPVKRKIKIKTVKAMDDET